MFGSRRPFRWITICSGDAVDVTTPSQKRRDRECANTYIHVALLVAPSARRELPAHAEYQQNDLDAPAQSADTTDKPTKFSVSFFVVGVS